MKVFTNLDVDYVYEYLLDNLLFEEEELNLVIKAFGDNIENYNLICYVRYGMDFQQIFESKGE